MDMGKIERWERELSRLQVTWRWGECRRFQSNKWKIERRDCLIDHIAKERNKVDGTKKD